MKRADRRNITERAATVLSALHSGQLTQSGALT
jgi:hypothetical protein